MRVVLDTNVLVSALLFKGRLSRLYHSIEQEELVLCFTEATFDELVFVLRRRKFEHAFRRQEISSDDVIRFVRIRAHVVPTPPDIEAVVVEDPADNHILAAALACKANCIVSGDIHLRQIGLFGDIPILTPQQFLALL